MTIKHSRWHVLPIIALLMGMAIMSIGFTVESMQGIQGKFAHVGFLALVVLLFFLGAMRKPEWSRVILFGGFVLGLVVAFGWMPVVLLIAAGISFSVVGSFIYRPGDGHFSTLFPLATIGAAVFVVVLNVLVRFEINTPFTYGLLLLLPCLHVRTLKDVLGRFASSFQSGTSLSRGEIGVGSLLLFIVVLHLAGAGLPERYADGALYHLYLNQTVARLGFWPGDFHSFVWALMPAGTDWLNGIGEVLAGQLGTKAMSFLVFILMLGAVYHASLVSGVTRARSLLVTALVASTPMAFIETTTLFIENGLTLFVFCAFLVLSEKDLSVRRRVICGAILIAAALATKLHAVVFAAPLGMFALWISWRDGSRRNFYDICVAIGILAIGSFAYAYAYVKTGNPIFPFFNAIFKSPYYALENFADTRWHQPPPWDLFYKITFHTHLYGEFRDGAFGFQAIALVAAIVLATILTNPRRQCMAVFVGLFYIFVISMSTTYARYLYPGLVFVSYGAGALLMLSCKNQTIDRYWKRVVGLAVTLVIVLNVCFFNSAGWPLEQNFLAGFTSQEKWEKVAEQSLPQLALNRRASQDGVPSPRVLLFGDAVAANIAGTPLPVNWYNSPLVDKFRHAKTVEDIRQILAQVKATHASFDFRNNLYQLNTKLIGEALEKFGEPIFRESTLVLYRIHPDVWLGPNLAGEGSAANGFNGWSAHGNISPIDASGVLLGHDMTIERAIEKPLLPNRLHRVTVSMMCGDTKQSLHLAVLLSPAANGKSVRFDDLLPCNATGLIERHFDFVTPSAPAAAQLILDHAEAKLLAITVREGYYVRGGYGVE